MDPGKVFHGKRKIWMALVNQQLPALNCCIYEAVIIAYDRLLGWWSIDEGSRKERARIYCAGGSGYVFYATI